MAAPKIITVFGATGEQGNAVAKCLLQDPQYKVRAVTGTTSDAKAQELSKQGAQVVKADLNDRASIKEALADAHGCFVITETNFASSNPENDEVKLGENIADVCMVLKIQHVVFSTAPNVRDVTGGSARHWDAKARIYTFMSDRELSLTGVMLPFDYGSLLTEFKCQRTAEHSYKLCIPMGDVSLNLLSMEDFGKAVHYIFNHRDECLHKTYPLVGDKRTVKEMAVVLSNELRPNCIQDAGYTFHQLKTKPLPDSGDKANMFEYIQREDLRFNLDTTRRMVPNVVNFTTWVKANKDALLKSLIEPKV